MRVSIITVTFNSELYLEDTLLSIFSQSYPNIECIIIDGNSTDGTVSILQKYQNKITYISEPDSGIYDAMNKGFSLITGDLVGFLNSDDIFLDDNVIENLIKSFDDRNFDIIYSNLYYVERRNTNKIVRKWKSGKYYDKFFDDGNVPPHPTFYIKSDCLKKMGLFNLNFNLAADYEFMFRALKIYKFQSYFVDLYTVKMRMGGATNMTFSNIFKQNIEILNAWKINDVKVPLFFIPLKFFKKITQYFQYD
jgi:glycosyltransferase involved in cell wall biosynthesis